MCVIYYSKIIKCEGNFLKLFIYIGQSEEFEEQKSRARRLKLELKPITVSENNKRDLSNVSDKN